MVRTLPHLVARPLIGRWLATSAHSWQLRAMAADSSHLHAPELNPDRVLLAGDGVAAGREVRTHDLGLAGHLARGLSLLTGRPTDVDIVVDREMTAAACLLAVRDLDLYRFDAIVVSLGGAEALALTGILEWKTALEALLDDLELRAPVATRILLLSIPPFGTNPRFPTRLADVVDRHVHELNLAMCEFVTARPRVDVIPSPDIGFSGPPAAHCYQRWAGAIAARISSTLDPPRPQSDSTEGPAEAARQQALEDLRIRVTEPDPVLDDIAESARTAFRTPIAAITVIDGDTQRTKAVTGMDRVTTPRAESLCSVTIRHPSPLVIEDATADPRYADFPAVTGEPGIRFYAGYPIESPDGHRIGALCVMDTVPHPSTAVGIGPLRALAEQVQEHLWKRMPA